MKNFLLMASTSQSPLTWKLNVKGNVKKCSLSWFDGYFDDNGGEDDGDIDDDESDFDNGEIVWMVIFRRRNVRSISLFQNRVWLVSVIF